MRSLWSFLPIARSPSRNAPTLRCATLHPSRTGHVLSRAEADLLAKECIAHNVIVLSDEVYERKARGELAGSGSAGGGKHNTADMMSVRTVQRAVRWALPGGCWL